MKIYEPLTEKRPDETFDQWYARDALAKKSKEQWEQGRLFAGILDQPEGPEPDWNKWEPPAPLPAPFAWPPTDPLPPRATWALPLPVAGRPAASSGPFDPSGPPGPLFGADAPAQPVVVYSNGNVEVLSKLPELEPGRPLPVMEYQPYGNSFIWVQPDGTKTATPFPYG